MANPANNPPEELKMTLRAPGQHGELVTVTITAAEFFSITDVTDPAVLLYWRTFEVMGQQPTAESVWRHMANQGMRDDGHPTIQQETVQASVDRLSAQGLISQASGGAE